MDIKTTRIANARIAIERVGGVGKAAEKMGYSNPSFLVQMFGPNPTRVASEKTMRRMEESFALEAGSLDKPAQNYLPPAAQVGEARSLKIDTTQLSRAIAMVDRLVTEEKVQLSGDRFASLVSIAYEDSTDHAGLPSESKLRQVVQLLK